MRRRVAIVLVALAVVAPGCGTEGLSFVNDHRVALVSPADRDTVTVPFTISWTVAGFATGAQAGSFAVLVDRIPPPPGKSLEWLFRDDELCARETCLDPAYRAKRGVYRTTATSIVVPEVFTQPGRGDDLHEVTVVLLDRDGRRSGEGAWSTQFRVDRP